MAKADSRGGKIARRALRLAAGVSFALAIAMLPSSSHGHTRERPLPPEFDFASDSLFPVMHDAGRARWVLERLKPIIAKFPNHAPFRQIRFWALANQGAPVQTLVALTDSLVTGVSPRGRREPPGRLQRAQHCLELAQVLIARKEALPTAEVYLQRALQFIDPNQPALRATCQDLLARVRRLQDRTATPRKSP